MRRNQETQSKQITGDAVYQSKRFRSTKSGNLDFVTALSKWVLKESGVLRVKSVKHNRVGEKEPPREYTIIRENVVRSNRMMRF